MKAGKSKDHNIHKSKAPRVKLTKIMVIGQMYYLKNQQV